MERSWLEASVSCVHMIWLCAIHVMTTHLDAGTGDVHANEHLANTTFDTSVKCFCTDVEH